MKNRSKKSIIPPLFLALIFVFCSCGQSNINTSSKEVSKNLSETTLSNEATTSDDTLSKPYLKKDSSENSSNKPSSNKPSSNKPSSGKPSSNKPYSKETSTTTSAETEIDYEFDDDYYEYIRPQYKITSDKSLNPFTIAIYPDTQQEVVIEDAIKNKHFLNRSQWLVDNAKNLNLKFVVHTGDVVNWGNEDPKQFDIASEALKPLDKANIPTMLCLGNHDTAAVGVGGSAADPQNTWIRVRDTDAFNKAFPTSRYPRFVPFEEGKIDNGFQLISAGGLKWLVMTLELWPRDEVITWANLVISDYSDYNVIIATHSYLTDSGAIYNRADYGSNSPKDLYERLIKQHANIKMVFSGHTGNALVREDTGIYGNKITSFLGAFHSNTRNPVQLMSVDPANDEVSVRFYSPIDNTELTEYNCTVSNMGFIKPKK